MNVMTLVEGKQVQTNLLYMYRGEMPPNGGVGHHYHTRVEEMLMIFDNEAEFTIDGRIARLKGPIGAPVRYNHSHAIYHSSSLPTQWMNIGVSAVKGVGGGAISATIGLACRWIRSRCSSRCRSTRNSSGPSRVCSGARASRIIAERSDLTTLQQLGLRRSSRTAPWRHARSASHQGLEEIFYVMQGA